MTKGQEEFVDQLTRKMMVDWCYAATLNGTGSVPIQDGDKSPFTAYAVTKKWLAPSENRSTGWMHFKVLSAGWDTAARFLKR